MKEFTFTFTKAEAVDYYTYLLSSKPSNRLKQIFIIFSVPLLLILTVVFFKLNQILIRIGVTVVSIVWIMIIAPRFWKNYTKINIGEKFLEKNNLVFKPVKVKVEETALTVDGKRYEVTDKVKIVKTPMVTIFFFENQPVAIPNRFLNK